MKSHLSLEAEQAATAYGVEPGSMQPLASVYRSVAAYRAGETVLKPYRHGERQLYYAIRALAHVAQRGCALLPRLVLTRKGEPYLRTGRQLWYALTWIPGRPVSFPADLVDAAFSMAHFHRAAVGCYIPASDTRSWPRRWQQIRTEIQAFAQQAAAGETPFDILYSQAAPLFLQRTEACLRALDQPAYSALETARRASRSFAHRDATAANLIRADDGRIYLIDPDTLGPDLRLHDLTRLLLSAPPEEPDALVQAIATYEQIAPLEPAERQLLPAAYRLPREFWWAGVCRYRHSRPAVDPDELLAIAIAGAPGRDACAQRLEEALT